MTSTTLSVRRPCHLSSESEESCHPPAKTLARFPPNLDVVPSMRHVKRSARRESLFIGCRGSSEEMFVTFDVLKRWHIHSVSFHTFAEADLVVFRSRDTRDELGRELRCGPAGPEQPYGDMSTAL